MLTARISPVTTHSALLHRDQLGTALHDANLAGSRRPVAVGLGICTLLAIRAGAPADALPAAAPLVRLAARAFVLLFFTQVLVWQRWQRL